MSSDGFDVSVQLTRGETRVGASFATGPGVTVLFGPSGVGKTSVLHMVAGLLRPDKGRVAVAGRALFDSRRNLDVAPHHRGAGCVFQEPRLFPHRRVRANLLYGAPDAARLADVAAMLDVAHLLGRWPRSLSGGEARRVAIGRALLAEPDFLLLDEPMSSLDGARREEAMRAVERVRDGARVPVLLVTHDRSEADRLGNHLVTL